MRLLLLITTALLAHLTTAQISPADASQIVASIYSGATPSSTTLSPSRSPSTSTSSSPATSSTSSTSDPNNDTPDLFKYVFALVAPFLCFVGVTACVVLQRKKRAMTAMRSNRSLAVAEEELAQRRPGRWAQDRHWHGHGTPERERVEGLDERGEAPPPYMPKAFREDEAGLAVPLRTLGRGDVGVKPPDYVREIAQGNPETGSGGNGSSSEAVRAVAEEEEGEEEGNARRSGAGQDGQRPTRDA